MASGPGANPRGRARALLGFVLALQLTFTVSAVRATEQPMYFNHIGMLQGLAQNTVMVARQDRQGFVWLGTEGGLDRWDGYAMRHYRRDGHGNGLANDFIWDIAEDRAGNLWLATDGGGLARWNRSTDRFDSWRHVATDRASLASDKVRTLLIAPDGRIWVGTHGGGLDVFDPRSGHFSHFRHRANDAGSLPDDAVYALRLDRHGALWIGTDGGLTRMDPARGTLRTWRHDRDRDGSLCGNEVRGIVERATGELWVATFGQGLCRFDATRTSFTAFQHHPVVATSLSDNDVRALYEDDRQRLWIGTANGLNLLEDRTGQFIHAYSDGGPDGLSDSYVMSLYQDRGGVLWVGTRSAGVNAWNPRSWSFGHFNPPWSRGTNITSFATASGSTWIGTMGHGLVRLVDGERGPPVVLRKHAAPGGSPQPALPDDRVMSLLGDRDGSVWVGMMTGGLLHLRPDTPLRSEVFRHLAGAPDSLSANGVMALYADADANLWVGTYGGGVNMRRHGESKFRHYGADTALTRANATAIAQDRDGGIWIGTDAGLYALDPATGRVHRFLHALDAAESLGADSIYALHVDASGTLWVGTAGGGLNRVRGTARSPSAVRFQTVSQAQGLASDVVYGIESDTAGSLWISGNNGLSRYLPANGEVQTFHRSHGLQAEEFNFGAHYRGPDGRLWFGGANGYNAFSPQALQRNTRPPQVVLTRFEKFDRLAVTSIPHPLLNTVHLAAGESMFTFDFAALDFTAPAKNRYAYFLEGFDAGWIDAGYGHRATYTNLDPGHYRFHVRASNSEGVWNTAGLLIGVDIDAPLWRTPLAYALYFAAGLLLVGLLLRTAHARRRAKAAYLEQLEAQVQERTGQLKERNEELRQLAAAKGELVARVSHELRTPIAGVLGMVDLLLRTALDVRQSRLADTIKRSAGSLLDIINDILDFSKIEAGRLTLEQIAFDLEQVADESVEAVAVLAQRKGLEIICDAPSSGLPAVTGDPLRLRQILANLLGNALKFTDRGEVVLRIEIAAQDHARMTLHIDVSDTGAGIQPANLHKIFESFAQEDSTTSRRFGGTGLGLSITRQLVELMGGTISVRSAPGAGSVFRVVLTFALAPIASAAAVAAAPGEAAAANESLAGCSILLAGGSGALPALIARHLTHAGSQVTVADSAPRALAQARAGGTIDIALIIATGAAGEPAWTQELAACTRLGAMLLVPLDTGADVAAARVETLLRPAPRVALLTALRRQLGVAAPSAAINAAAVDAAAKYRLGGRVLVVEDNCVNQEITVSMLEILGVASTVAGSGEEAVACAAAHAFDLVLLDCGLPGMSGYEAVAALRLLPNARPRLPILAFTANSSPAERQRCLAAGMNDVLTKPCTLGDLRHALEHWLPQVDAASGDRVDAPGDRGATADDGAATPALRAARQ